MAETLAQADFASIKARVAMRADEVVGQHLKDAEKSGDRWFARNPRRIDKTIGSFMVHGSRSPRAGSFVDFACGEKGDAFDLIAYLKGFGYKDRSAALRESLDFLGELHHKPDPAKVARELAEARRQQDKADAARAAEQQRGRDRAMAIWRDAAPIAGTAAETYLRQCRGIDLDRLAHPPSALRFAHLANWLEPKGEDGRHPVFPSLVAAMSRLGQPIAALQRTALMADGSDKAALRKPKLIFPESRGAVIRIARGINDCSPEAAAKLGLCGETLIVCEGAEDALTCALAMPEARVWACCGVGNLRYVDPGPTVSHVIVAADADWSGSAARAALDDGLWVLKQQNFDVRVAFPAEGSKDFNDWLRGAA
jgi:hypothetical protein